MSVGTNPHLRLAVADWPGGRVLVTGASGLVGGRLVELLRHLAVPVTALVREGRQVKRLQSLGADIAWGDVLDAGSIRRAATGCLGVLNCAARTNRMKTNSGDGWRVNTEGPGIVWRAAGESGVSRVVHCSTAGVHGPLLQWPIDEDGPLRPDSRYRRSKLEGERLLQAVAERETGPEVVIARPATVCGPGSGRTWRSVYHSVRRQRVLLIGPAVHPYHVTDVDDVCQGLIRCLTKPQAAGGRYFLAAAEALPLRELLGCFAAEEGVELKARQLPGWASAPMARLAVNTGARIGWEPALLQSLNFLTAPRAYHIDRARHDLDFEPAFDAPQTIARTVAAIHDDADDLQPHAAV